jgi:hypothetical protein
MFHVGESVLVPTSMEDFYGIIESESLAGVFIVSVEGGTRLELPGWSIRPARQAAV